jgi:hypothetical protein
VRMNQEGTCRTRSRTSPPPGLTRSRRGRGCTRPRSGPARGCTCPACTAGRRWHLKHRRRWSRSLGRTAGSSASPRRLKRSQARTDCTTTTRAMPSTIQRGTRSMRMRSRTSQLGTPRRLLTHSRARLCPCCKGCIAWPPRRSRSLAGKEGRNLGRRSPEFRYRSQLGMQRKTPTSGRGQR